MQEPSTKYQYLSALVGELGEFSIFEDVFVVGNGLAN